jgi:pimeloyl-ACP methyl ester carboxylesterase
MTPLLAFEQSGSGEPLVLIHGLATTRAVWSAVTPALSRTRRVVALDVPGFGDSPPAGEGFELTAVAERIVRGLAARAVTAPFDLVGHSLGAGVAIAIADQRPEIVRRLVLVAPAGFARLPPAAMSLLANGVDGMLAARRALAGLTDRAWGRRLLLAFAAADPAGMSPTQARMIVGGSAGARRSAEAFATIAGADLRPALRRAAAPVGAIWGAEDRTVPPRLAARVRAARPDTEIVFIDRAGHIAMVERPEAFVAALQGLLDRLPGHATSTASDPINVP